MSKGKRHFCQTLAIKDWNELPVLKAEHSVTVTVSTSTQFSLLAAVLQITFIFMTCHDLPHEYSLQLSIVTLQITLQ